MNRIIKASLLFLGIFSLSGCSQRLVDFTIISTKNIDLSRAASFRRTAGRATGEDVKHIIILFPTGTPSAKEAVDRAIESVPGGVALVDGVLTRSFFYIPYVFGETKFIVEGTVLVDPALSGKTTAASHVPSHSVVICNRDGEVVSNRAVSKTEYLKLKKDLKLVASAEGGAVAPVAF